MRPNAGQTPEGAVDPAIFTRRTVTMMHIALGLHNKNNYFIHTLTCVHSILTNTRERVHIHVLHDRTLNSDCRAHFKKLAAHFRAEMDFFDMSDSVAPYLGNDMKSFSIAMLFRIFIPELMPDDDILYIDSDVCCNMDIARLFREVRAAPDASIHVVRDEAICLADFATHVLSLGIDPRNYFNSGVIVFNTRRLNARCSDFSERMASLLRETARNFPDQDALNIYFLLEKKEQREVHYLDNVYNFNISIKKRHMLKPDRLSTFIVHYGYHKPWEKIFPAALLYWKYREELFRILATADAS